MVCIDVIVFMIGEFGMGKEVFVCYIYDWLICVFVKFFFGVVCGHIS